MLPPNVFKPGEINFEQAEALNRMVVEINRLIGLAVVPPLELYDFAGGKTLMLQQTNNLYLAATLCECADLKASFVLTPKVTPLWARLAECSTLKARYVRPALFLWARLTECATLKARYYRPPLFIWARLSECSTLKSYMGPAGITGTYTLVTGVTCVNGVIVQTTMDFTWTNGILTDVV